MIKQELKHLICATDCIRLVNEQFWQWYVSITEISSISLESTSSDKVEWKIGEDDKNEAQVEGEENEMKHYKIKEHIFRQAQ